MRQSKIEKIKFRIKKENIKLNHLSKLDILNIFIGVIGLLTPYLIGMAFYQGNLNVFGLETSFFPISTVETYTYSYYAVLFIVLAVLVIIFFIPVLLHTAGILHWSISLILMLLIKHFDFKVVNKLSNGVNNWLLNLIKKIASYSRNRLVVFFIIFLVISPYGAYKIGEFDSTQYRSGYQENGCYFKTNSLWSNCSSLQAKDGTILSKGFLIANSKEHVAFFNCQGAVIIQIPKGGTVSKELKKAEDKSEKKSKPFCKSFTS